MKRHLVPLVALTAAGLIGGIGGGALVAATDDDPRTVAADAPAQPTADRSAPAHDVSEIYKDAIEGVVKVTATSGFGGGTGSGFVIDDDGHVVTNHHVVEGATGVTVTFGDGEERKATVVGSDGSTDVALLRVENAEGLEPLPLGSTAALEIGDPVIAIGSPFGLDGTLTTGVVSGLDREIRAPDGFGIDGVIQTDAALNRGNSGGPLLDSQGRVVGINSQIQSETGASAGIGYAVPIETVRDIVEQLKADGEVEHAYLGVQLSDADDGGARLERIVPRTPAAEAGLEAGDVVKRANGEPVDDGEALRDAVDALEPGDELELELERGGDTETVTVELGSRPDSID